MYCHLKEVVKIDTQEKPFKKVLKMASVHTVIGYDESDEEKVAGASTSDDNSLAQVMVSSQLQSQKSRKKKKKGSVSQSVNVPSAAPGYHSSSLLQHSTCSPWYNSKITSQHPSLPSSRYKLQLHPGLHSNAKVVRGGVGQPGGGNTVPNQGGGMRFNFAQPIVGNPQPLQPPAPKPPKGLAGLPST